jgi:hypothetical protein
MKKILLLSSFISKRRAASVKTMLGKEFGIDESRMQTDGKGESESIDKNDNSAGKANNRRVEFIKICCSTGILLLSQSKTYKYVSL